MVAEHAFLRGELGCGWAKELRVTPFWGTSRIATIFSGAGMGGSTRREESPAYETRRDRRSNCCNTVV